MKLVPYVDYVLCEEIEEPKQTAGGIILPETADRKTSDTLERGRVTAASGFTWSDGMPCIGGADLGDLVGKIVIYQCHAGYWHTDKDGKKLRIVQYKDICAVEVE